jgi:hypothetical protein
MWITAYPFPSEHQPSCVSGSHKDPGASAINGDTLE